MAAGAEIQLLPAGSFRARDGRPHGLNAWRIDATIAARLIAEAEARKTPYVIDYEHQSLEAAENGQPAPAAGWFKRLEWREAQGLYAMDVQWTERAKAYLQANEYRFLSPVFAYDKKTGDIQKLINAGLTNNPAIDGMAELLARAAARFALTPAPLPAGEGNNATETAMNETLRKLLGLPENPTDEQIAAACATLTEKLGQAEQAGTELAALKTEVAALKTGKPDPAKYVPIEAVTELQTEFAALRAQLVTKEVDDLVEVALSEGKLLPALADWAKDLGKKDLAALKNYLAKAQPIAALKSTQTKGQAPAGGASANSGQPLEARCKAAWEKDEALREEFGGRFETYLALCKHEPDQAPA